MRNLVEQAQKVHEIATQVISTTSSTTSITSSSTHQIHNVSSTSVGTQSFISTIAQLNKMDSTILSTQPPPELNYDVDGVHSEDEYGRTSSTQMSVSSEPVAHANHQNNLYHGTWPVERTSMWASDPSNLNPDGSPRPANTHINIDQASVLSFASSSGGAPLDRVLGSPDRLTRRSMQQLEAKVDMVYSLLAMLGGQEHADMGDTLLALSTSPESCLAMRQSGCIPLLVQLVQSDKDFETRKKASQALHNLIYAQPDEKTRKREVRVLKLLEQTSGYVEALKNNTEFTISSSSSTSESSEQSDEKHPVAIIANLMKHSFDEGHRQAICQLGGIQVIASLVETEHTLHGNAHDNTACILMRRYACMALTNLTFGDSGNKALLCSHREFMRALVVQLQSLSDELRQVTASVLRNLSWRADQSSKEILREVGTVTGLMKAGMATTKENTLKSILSALWNLSAHCTENKLEICAVENGLGFLVNMLSYKAPSSSLTINENAGGILRNISSQIAVRDDYREILRKHNCLQMLLEQLKSPSLTIVSNACGTLWNLSAKNQIDQEALWQMGAPAMLRSLNHSKHKMIATGSSAALKNLLNSRPSHSLLPQMDSTARAMDLPALPTLGARKQKALMRDLDQNLSETFENIERDSPTKLQRDEKLLFDKAMLQKQRSATKDKIGTRTESHEFGTHVNLGYDNELVDGFASLNLSEPSTSFNKSQLYGSSSLVYMSNRENKSYRNYASNYTEEQESEQPIDYSRKYSESQKKTSNGAAFSNDDAKSETEKEKSYDGIYAETDLDQPTDYSLRYAEDDSDSDCSKKVSEFVQDTIKTYYTEGTPYETPINFSTATSMSDLRCVDIDNDKSKDRNKETKAPTLSHLDEKDHCSVEDITDLENVKCDSRIPPMPNSEFSSGLMSPEKPVNYCEEGTPGYFSRVSSFGSLTSIPVNQETKPKEPMTPPRVTHEETKKVPASSAESKAVKFGTSVNYAEQTPLMFSRSSSLASLDSVEQHSIHDDRSSVVSDFSRLTSGIVSPSELPDSPTQTVPPSPRPRKAIDYPSTSRFGNRDVRPQPAPRNLIQKPSVFEDNVTKFKEESTPAQFSTATSISSLTIDDQDEPVCGDIVNRRENKPETPLLTEEDIEKQDVQEKPDSSSEFNEQLSENDEDDDILADCINIGMQNNRHRQTKTGSQHESSSKIPSLNNLKSSHGRPHGSGIPIPRSGIPTPRSIVSGASASRSATNATALNADCMRTYYTEDTPAVLSHAGSNSDLSVLSMQTDNKSRKDYLSDDSSNLSGDNDNILAECIQSGMPKAKSAQVLPKRQTSTRNLSTSTPIKPFTRENLPERKNTIPSYLGARDEVANFEVENSPCQFSLRSSLSDLTVDGSVAGGVRTLGEGETDPNSPTTGVTRKSTNLNAPGPSTALHNTTGTSCNTTNELSRQESLSSLSVESFGSVETEQALLEQCISSGMPKSKHTVTPNKNQDKPIGVATKHFNKHAEYSNRVPNTASEKENERSSELKSSISKNVNAASAVGSTKQASPQPTALQATDVGANTPNPGHEIASPKAATKMLASPGNNNTLLDQNGPHPVVDQSFHDISLVKSSHTEENLLTALTKSGCDKSLGKFLENSISNSSYSNSDNCANLDKSDEEIKSTNGGALVDSRMLDPDAMIESLDRFTAELVSQATINKEENKCSTSVNEGDTWNEDVTFPSISGSVPNVITFSDKPDAPQPAVNILDVLDGPGSNDFSSLNTSTMTESTLIAMEATKMALTFQNEADMSRSTISNASLELDQVQPPSHMNSISSAVETPPRSPRTTRKRSLPAGLMVRRALSNSLNQVGSLESLVGNNSVTNLEQMNPPSLLAEVNDMDGSLISVASIPSDNADYQHSYGRFAHVEQPNPIFNVKQPANMLHLMTNHSNANSISNLENINPPSLFDEVTDLCNSLADVTTNFETAEVFDDCTTYQQTEDDATEFSDANSITPIQSDVSSAESTPKKNRVLTPRERRCIDKERYRTYTVDADKIMTQDDDSAAEDFHTVCADTFTSADPDSFKTVAETYSTATFTRSPKKLTPKERRQQDQARFQTQVLSRPNVPSVITEPTTALTTPAPATDDQPKSKIGVRKQHLLQRRHENKERFKTQTISTTTSNLTAPSTIALGAAGQPSADVLQLLQHEARVVLNSLNETRTDELLDETLSLVSNDDDSEPNSRCSISYRTYRKSSSTSSGHIPVIPTASPRRSVSCDRNENHDQSNDEQEDPEENRTTDLKTFGKPKIVKPSDNPQPVVEAEVQDKAIRGRRKPLYSRPLKSNPVRAVTPPSQTKLLAKPPMAQPKLQKAKTTINTPLQREGTFTKDEKKNSKIPSAIPKAASTSRIARPNGTTMGTQIRSKLPSLGGRSGLVKSASSDRANKPLNRVYQRSPSADSRVTPSSTTVKTQLSPASSPKNGAVRKTTDKKPAINNAAAGLNGLNASGKQITSRIASLWKQVEESKKQPLKKDTRVWIQANTAPQSEIVPSTTTN